MNFISKLKTLQDQDSFLDKRIAILDGGRLSYLPNFKDGTLVYLCEVQSRV